MQRSIWILIIFLIGCRTDKAPRELYVQKIPNSSKIIYWFRYDGAFVTSSDFTGYQISDPSELFALNRKYLLPEGHITEIDTNGKIEMSNLTYIENHEFTNDTISIREELINGFKIRITTLNCVYGKQSSFSFDSLQEESNNITLIGIHVDFGNFPTDSIKFNKGGIFINDSSGIVKTMSLGRTITRRNKNENNNIEFGNEIITMTPNYKLETSSLSDYGFFKRIKMPEN